MVYIISAINTSLAHLHTLLVPPGDHVTVQYSANIKVMGHPGIGMVYMSPHKQQSAISAYTHCLFRQVAMELYSADNISKGFCECTVLHIVVLWQLVLVPSQHVRCCRIPNGSQLDPMCFWPGNLFPGRLQDTAQSFPILVSLLSVWSSGFCSNLCCRDCSST